MDPDDIGDIGDDEREEGFLLSTIALGSYTNSTLSIGLHRTHFVGSIKSLNVPENIRDTPYSTHISHNFLVNSNS